MRLLHYTTLLTTLLTKLHYKLKQLKIKIFLILVLEKLDYMMECIKCALICLFCFCIDDVLVGFTSLCRWTWLRTGRPQLPHGPLPAEWTGTPRSCAQLWASHPSVAQGYTWQGAGVQMLLHHREGLWWSQNPRTFCWDTTVGKRGEMKG